MLNVSEVLTILEKEGLTSSRQVVLRWIRQGDLPAVQESRKTGYQVNRTDLDDFISKKKEAATSTESAEQITNDYRAGYQAAIKDLLEIAMVSGSGDLFLFRKNASIPIHLADFKEMAARNFSTGKNNPFYQTAIKNLFHPFGRKTPENVIYVYPLGDYYKLANLIVSKDELADFMKEMDLEGASLSDVFANLYLYYLTSGKVK
ncbi:hypothetical protein SAMN04488048_1571 [Trichococcus flocculiformis]|uniref:helix-turn-helix domain-containing protein n=1 Tax=Trichococcus TaxID=82802 RepID=UPI0007A7EAF6|nr:MULTISPECIES: helix-turn-helix domain-containing protein [Trichococcus]CZQ98950.1 Hypothetical protein TES5_1580 [Trichococcus sp. ES5]SHG27823.1 hypothetical protein SAMN04488048_1571 [Trichococcus flocculiformis]